MKTTEISCLCGAVKVRIKGEPVEQFYCHCDDCHRCAACGTQLMAEVPGLDQVGVKANLLPADMFKPRFHINCRYAVLPVKDDLPHFKSFPAKFGGSDETVNW